MCRLSNKLDFKKMSDCVKSKIQIFKNPEFGEIRTVTIDGEPWFVGKDVCVAFGDKNHNRSLSRVDDDDKKEKEIIDSIGRKQKAICINESGLYSLLFSMQPQKANNDGVSDAYPTEVQKRIDKLHRFKRWVTSEVLPSIRKHGAYMTPSTIEKVLSDPDTIIRLATDLKKEREQRKRLENKVEEDKPKVLFANAVSASESSILIGQLAKMLKQNGIDIGQNRLFEWLRQNGYLIRKKGSNYNLPTQRAMEMGLFQIKESTHLNGDGVNVTTRTTKVTGKGQQYFINKFLGGESRDAG